MQRQESKSGRGDILIFIGIAAMAFMLVHMLGLFVPHSGGAPLERLQRVPSALASQLASVLDPSGQWRWGTPGVSAAPPPGRTYRVKAGDTLSLIARRHEVELPALVASNRLVNPDLLEVGQQLTIPGGDGDAPGPPATAEPRTPGFFVAFQTWLLDWLGSPDADGATTAQSDAAALPEQALATPDPAEVRALEALIAMAEEELRAAQFEAALHTATAAERLLETSPDDHVLTLQRARVEVVRATVHSAFGNDAETQQSLERALAADPLLELDPASSPRKLRRALEATQERRHASADPLGSP